MKKVLAIVLAFVLAFSSFCVFASAEGEPIIVKVPDGMDYATFVESTKQMSGATQFPSNLLYTMYNDPVGSLVWSTLPLTEGDVALAKANLNTYMSNMAKKYFSDDKLCTGQNATKLCNFIGHLFFTNYADKTIQFASDPVKPDEFYNRIATESGLSDLIHNNWCMDYYTPGSYEDLLSILGFDFNALPVRERDIRVGSVVAPILIKSVVNALRRDPLTYLLKLLLNFANHYDTVHFVTVKALFMDKISGGIITNEEIATLKGFMNLLSNDNDPTSSNKLQYYDFPVRFRSSKDENELFLYLVIYLDLIGSCGTNPTAVGKIRDKINASRFSADEKEKLSSTVDGVLGGQINSLFTTIEDMAIDNTNQVVPNLFEKLISILKGYLENLVNLFDRMMKSLDSVFNPS